ncbi:MAG TPA: 2-dehydropantoate 2-reductase [Desulfobacterales bacterium]|nr:2-dehydropantoate 2-reductase [Desulfobacterales bacterium]
MKIVIVGAGAIGMLTGAYLAKGGNEVVFVEKDKDTVSAVNQYGVGLMALVTDEPTALVFAPARAFSDPREIKSCDLIILAVKSFDTHTAISSVAHLISKNSPVLSIQTGLGNLKIMEQVVGRENIICGFTYMAAAALGPGKVRLGGRGWTYLGELNDQETSRVLQISKTLNDCGLETEVVPKIVEKIWSKVLVYSAINPIAGLLRVKNGQLLEKMESISLAKRLIDEGRLVAEAGGLDLSEFDLYDLFFETCKATSENVSSMLLDLLSNRKTEIEALNGEIIRQGNKYDLPVTTHMTIMELIKLCEKWTVGGQPQSS